MDETGEDLLETIENLSDERKSWRLYLSLFFSEGCNDSKVLHVLKSLGEAERCRDSKGPLTSTLCVRDAIHTKGGSTLWRHFTSIRPVGAVLTELFSTQVCKEHQTPSLGHWSKILLSLGVSLKENMLQVLQGQIGFSTVLNVSQLIEIYKSSNFLHPSIDVHGTCYLVATLGNYALLEDYWMTEPASGPNELIEMKLGESKWCPSGVCCKIHPLALATILDDPRLVEYLLKKGGDPTRADNTFYGALQLAVFMKKEKMFKLFLKTSSVEMMPCHPVTIALCLPSKDILAALLNNKVTGKELDFLDGHTLSSPLMGAIICGELSRVKALTKKKASVDFPDAEGYTPIYYAIYAEPHYSSTGMKVIKHLLSCCPGAVNHPSRGNLTPLLFAAYMGRPEVCKVLLKKGAQCDAVDGAGRSVIHWGVLSGEMSCLKFLLTHQDCAELVNRVDNSGATPLHYAAFLGLSEHVKLLTSKGADVNSECKHSTTPLLWAIASVKTEAIHALVMRGANIHHSSPAHQSMISLEDRSLLPCHPLLAAARVGSVEALRFLINMGVKVDVRGSDGSTALHHASVMGHTECMKLLLKANTPVDALTQWKETSLHLASMYSHGEAVAILLEAGASPHIRHPNRSNSVLHLSAMHGRVDCLETLLSSGKCDVNTTRPSDSYTALHIAAGCGEVQCVKCLLEHKANINAIDSSSEKCTPVDVALRENHLRTARVLTDFGGRTNGGTHHRAASLIQAVWKFHVHKRRKRLGTAWAANRVKSATKKFTLKKKATHLRIIRERERNWAALVIQKHWRQYIAKKRRYEATINQLRSKIRSERDGYSIIVSELHRQCLSVHLPSGRKPASTISSKALLKGPKSPPFPDCGNTRKQPVAKPQDSDSLLSIRKSVMKKKGLVRKETKGAKHVDGDAKTTKELEQEREDMRDIQNLILKAELQSQGKLPDIPRGRVSVVSPNNSSENVLPVKPAPVEHSQTNTTSKGGKEQSCSHSIVKLFPIQQKKHSGKLVNARSPGLGVGMKNSEDIISSLKLPSADLSTVDSLKSNKQRLKYTNIIEQCIQLRQVMESMDKVSDAHARREKLKLVLQEGIRLRAEVDAIQEDNG